MGNRKLRKKCAEIFRAHGWGKMYHRLTRKVRSKYFDPSTCRSIIKMGQFNVGDIVNDYDSNFVIVEIPAPYSRHAGYWHGRGIGSFKNEVPQFRYHNGLSSCGCGWHPDPPIAREKIEQFYREAVEDEEWPWSDEMKKRVAALAEGKHICDEHGVLLPEFDEAYRLEMEAMKEVNNG